MRKNAYCGLKIFRRCVD